ncbi:MAG: molybdate ABC transporter substrate-binding protein [Planctomycetota bacterium]
MSSQTRSRRVPCHSQWWSVLVLVLLSGWGCQRAVPPAPAPASDKSATAVEPPTKTRQVAVAMASDLRFVAPELQREFERESPDIKIEPTFGSSGKLFAQISNHGPFDVFLSADIQYPQKLTEQGLTKKDSLFRYAIGHIVLWVRNDSPLPIMEQGADILKDPRLKKVAIANPKLAPYGRAAEAALKKLGLYDGIESKLVLGENIAQTAQFAESGAADAAVIGLSFAMAPEFAGKGKYWEFPADAYPQMDQGGVILEQTKEPEAAKKFCDFLKAPRAQEILKKYGFVIPESP